MDAGSLWATRLRSPLSTVTPQGSASVRCLIRLALVLYLATYLVWTGPLTSALWERGEHPTLEHWANHLLFEHLGFHHHHAAAQQGQVADDGLTMAAVPFMPQIVAAPAVSGFTPDATLYPVVGALSILSPASSGRRLVLGDARLPSSQWPAPPEKPP